MSSPFCLTYCCHFLVKIYDTIKEKEKFLFPKESQRIWKLQDQDLLTIIFNDQVFSSSSSSSLQKTSFNILVAYKKQFACKKQFNSICQKLFNLTYKKQLVCKKQPSLTRQKSLNLAHKKQLACKKQFNLTR